MRKLVTCATAMLALTIGASLALAQPVFVSGSARVKYEKDEKEINAKAIQATSDAFAALKKQLGDRPVKCYFITDNLGAADVVNGQLKELFQGTPYGGIATNWQEYLPVHRDTLGEAPEKERGIAITAVCGDVDVQLESVEGLTKKDVSYDLPKDEWRKQWDAQKPLHAGKGAELAKKFTFPSGEGISNVLMVVGTMHTPRQELVFSGLRDNVPASVKLIGGSGADFATIYFNGQTFGNGLCGLRLSGKFQAVATGSKGGRNAKTSLPQHLQDLTERLGGAKPTAMIYFGCAGWKNNLPAQQQALQQYLPEGVGAYGQFCGGEIGQINAGVEPVADTDLGVIVLMGAAK